MQAKLTSYNAVVVASIFNPGKVREPFLREHGALTTEDAVQSAMYGDVMAMVTTPGVHFSVTPQQLVVAPQGEQLAADVTKRVVTGILAGFPDVELVAMGINLVWWLNPAPDTLPSATRRLFAPTRGPFADEFRADDAAFGVYFSQDVGGGIRLKMDIKPTRIEVEGSEQEVLLANFNFHSETKGLSRDMAAGIGKVVARWDELFAKSERIVGMMSP
jgi:hypothetical protein